MDITDFTSAFKLGSKAISMFKQIKDLMPTSPQKEAAEKTLKEAEDAFSIAEAKVAKELGYKLCKCTWPPQIMLSIGFQEDRERYKCPKCGNIKPHDSPPYEYKPADPRTGY